MATLEPYVNLIKDLFAAADGVQRCSEISARRLCVQHDLKRKDTEQYHTKSWSDWIKISQ